MTRFFGPESEPEPTPAPPPRLRPVGGPGVAASALIVISTAATVASVGAIWYGYRLVTDYIAGDPTVTEEDLDTADRLISGSSWAYLIFIVVTHIVFLVWLWRARTNAELLCNGQHRRSRGWVIGSWICPIVNLWFPYQVVDDIYRASRPDTRQDEDLRMVPGSRLLGWWWALWLGWAILDRIIARMWRDDEFTVDSLRTLAVLETIAVALMVGAAVLIIAIMRRITDWQHQAAEARPIATG